MASQHVHIYSTSMLFSFIHCISSDEALRAKTCHNTSLLFASSVLTFFVNIYIYISDSLYLLVFEEEFDIFVCKRDEIGGDESHYSKQDTRLVGVHLVDAPEEPCNKQRQNVSHSYPVLNSNEQDNA